MGFFNGTIEAIADGQVVRAEILADHDFNDGHAYNWTGLGTLTLDGHDWVGAGELVSLGPLPFGGDDAASPMTITLSGVNAAFVSEARSLPTVRGRSQLLYLQFFDADLQPLDTKYLLADRLMDVMGYSGVGPAQRSISLTSEDVWTARNTAEHANWSDANQQVLFPGDRGLEFVAELVPGKRITWPDFSV
jgi:hypothetical protein